MRRRNESEASIWGRTYIYAAWGLWRRGVWLLGVWVAAAWGWAAQVERYDIEAWIQPAQHRFEVTARITVSGRGSLELWLPRAFRILEAPGARIEERAQHRIRYPNLEPGRVLVIRAALEGPVALEGYFNLGAPRGYALDAWYPAELEYRPRPYTLTLYLPAGVRAVGPGVMVEAPGRVTLTGDGFGTPAFVYGPYRRVAAGRVELWYPPEAQPTGGRRAVQALATQVAGIVERYEALFGPGPDGPVRLVALELPGRMEGYGLAHTVLVPPHRFTKLAEGRLEPGAYAFLAHELAHTWWGNRVIPQEPGAWFLTEGTANYLAALLVEERFGPQVAGRLWEYWAALAARRDGSEAWRYTRAAWMHRTLEGLLGRAVYLEALAELARTTPFPNLEGFRVHLERKTRVGLAPLFAEWMTGRYPEYTLTREASGWVLENRGTGGATPVTVEVDGKRFPVVLEPSGRLVLGRARRVRLDPERYVLPLN
ncbi:M1 family aminopeptidase [Marinithermus hydrothermalis]|nr:M1 family aminopeptidase [Marinithermus hydrothermalis]